MITTIRSQLKQSTYRYVIFFLIFIIALSLVSSLFVKMDRLGGDQAWAIKVNGSEISYHEFSREVTKQTDYLSQIRAQYGQYADYLLQSLGWSIDPKTRSIDTLVREELLFQFSNKLGITLHDDYMSKIANNPQFVKQYLGHILPAFVFDQTGMLDMNIVKSYLQHSRITAQQFEIMLEKALIEQQAVDFLVATSYLPEFDVEQEIIARYAEKDFSFLTFSFDHYLAEAKKNSVNEDDLKAYYDAQNLKLRRYWVAEQRNGETFTFAPESYQIAVSDQEIHEYYEDNKVKSYVLNPLKVEVQQIMLQPLADMLSQTVDTIENEVKSKPAEYEKYWKTVKPFARGERKGEFEKNAFLLQNEGELSSAFETEDGMAIIRLVKRYPRTYKPLVNLKKEIEGILANKAFKKTFAKDIKNLIAQEDEKAMEAFIAQKSGNKDVVANISKDETVLSQQLFSLNKGQYGFYVENGVGVAVRLTDVVERYLPDLNSIKDVVTNDFYEDQAREQVQAAVAQARDMVKKESFDAVKSAFNATLNATGTFAYNDNKKIQELSKKGLPTHEMMAMEKQGAIIVFNGERNSFIIKLDAIKPLDRDKHAELSADIRNSLNLTRSRLLLDGAVASLHRNATIETNESILIMNENYSE